MPLFEYRCESCGSQFEELRAHNATDPVKCPHCGSKDVRKLVSCFAHSAGGSLRASAGGGNGCAGCSGGTCSTCGH